MSDQTTTDLADDDDWDMDAARKKFREMRAKADDLFDDEDKPDDYSIRSEALSAALKITSPGHSALEVLGAAKAFEAYLRGPAVPAEQKTGEQS